VIKHGYMVRVLGISQIEYFAVVALDFNIWGYGETREQAYDNLVEHIRVHLQLSKISSEKSIFTNDIAKEFIQMYNECVVAQLREETVQRWWITSIDPDTLDSRCANHSHVPNIELR